MSDIVWEDPPQKKAGGRPSLWLGRLAPLREHPGKWALMRTGTHSQFSVIGLRIRSGKYGPGFEAASRKRDDGTVGLYVRYVGDEATA